MADASHDLTPAGWGDAFAALPLESPPASRWPSIAAQLDARAEPAARPARRRRRWLMLAAALCALAVLPLAWTLRNAGDARDDSAPAAVAAAARTDPISAMRVDSADATSIDNSTATTATTVIAAHTSPPATMDAGRATQRDAHRTRRPAATRVADKSANAEFAAESSAASADDTAERALESLYAASTQLETLLALTRDTRVESGPAAALAGALDAELATIDAQLAQPGLAAPQQQTLWQARVDTLRQATGFETQQRMLAAQGRSYEGALVRVD